MTAAAVLAGLSAALAIILCTLLVVSAIYVWQNRARYRLWCILTEGEQAVLAIVLGVAVFEVHAVWQRTNATLSWAHSLWRADLSLSEGAVIYMPCGIIGTAMKLWGVLVSVLGKARGQRCWRGVIGVAVIVGIVVALIV